MHTHRAKHSGAATSPDEGRKTNERTSSFVLRPSEEFSAAGDAEEPVLDIHDIQGNILAGFNKDYQAFLFFRIVDVPGVKAWLRDIQPHISTLAEVASFNRLYKIMKARREVEPRGLTATWITIAFSFDGLA